MNWWQALALPVRLDLSSEEVEAAFRQASEGAHPDAGGEAGEFERLREARDGLRDHFRRLDAWLRHHEQEVAHSGAITAEVGEMFARVNLVTQGVDDWQAKGELVASGLGKALWQKEGFGWKGQLEEVLGEVSQWQERVGEQFREAEQGQVSGDFELALSLRGQLGFLRKWRQQLQERFGKIWEGLV